MKFFYKARSKEGKEQKGEIEASSQKSALEILEKHGLYVISLQAGKKALSFNISFGKGVSTKDLVMFTRQFSIMLKSSVPLLEALKSQVLQTTNPQLREKLMKMAESVETGSSLSRALSLETKVFGPFYVNMVKSGEATGKVADSLSYLADHLERDYNLKHKIRGALVYPGFVVAVFIGSFFLVSFFIVPRLSELLVSFKTNLPWTTRLVMGVSGFIRKGGWVLLLLLGGFVFFAPSIAKHFEKSKKLYDKIILKIPILGSFQKKIYLTQFAENLSVLIAAGLPITQALKITHDIISNTVYQAILSKAEERVSRGEKISSVLNAFPKEFPAFVCQMVFTGEETGRLDDVLLNVVQFYQEEISRTADNLTSILEPVLIVVLAGGVAVLAISLFVPLFQMGMSGI